MFGLYNFQGLFVCGGVNELFMIDTVGTVAVKPPVSHCRQFVSVRFYYFIVIRLTSAVFLLMNILFT